MSAIAEFSFPKIYCWTVMWYGNVRKAKSNISLIYKITYIALVFYK